MQIWNMSDPDKRGWLDKQGLFMALRLISVCQAGKDPSVASMSLTDPPPKLVGVEVTSTNKWTIEVSLVGSTAVSSVMSGQLILLLYLSII